MGEDGPLFSTGQLLVGNSKSGTAICTLWTMKDNLTSLPKERYNVIGNLYTSYGINQMLKNILANPRIRRILVLGEDLNATKGILVNFVDKGFDEDYRIKGTEAFLDKNLPRPALETLRKNIKVICLPATDSRQARKEIMALLEKVPLEEEQFMEPLVVKEESHCASLSSEEEIFRVEGKKMPETWLKLIDVIMKFGEEKPTEYGMKQREILGLATIIDEPDEAKLPGWFPFSESEIENYYAKFFNAEKPQGVAYTYGERLMGSPDQVKAAMERLKRNVHTRRAIAVTWRQEIDMPSQSPPCLTEVIWSVKNGRLHQTSIFRSQDMFGAWPLNIIALWKLQKRVAEGTGIPAGRLINISISAHIYENRWKDAETLLEQNYRGKRMLLEEDPRGFFIIRIEGGEIVAEHRLKDGRKSRYEFRGKSSEQIYRRILNENLISMVDHAAYIGKELAKAETCLREGKRYVQEDA